jgi:hypothetical protein
MKKTLFLIFICVLTFGASAQYQRIAKQGRTWYSYVQANWLGNSTMVVEVKGDTVLNGVQYALLFRNDSIRNTPGEAALVLEDTTSGSLTFYEISRGSFRDTVHYDFSLSQGDTFTTKGTVTNRSLHFIADSVFYQTDFNNVQRKVIWLKGADQNTWCYGNVVAIWIEGIGSTTNLGYPYPDCSAIIEAGFELKCVFDGSTKIYGDTVSNCYKVGLTETPIQSLSLYPNPVKDKLYLQSEWPITQAILLSVNGAIVNEFDDVQDDIDVSALKPGIYILQLMDSEGQIGRYKVVKED